MRLRDLSRIALLLAILHAAAAAHADSWRPPTTRQYTSDDGAWRLTVEPRELSDQLTYFREQIDGKERPCGIAGDTQTSAIGTMEHCLQEMCRRVWQRNLLNGVAPVGVVVTDTGRVMTFDNWHSMGFGPHAVVAYGPDGIPVAKYALVDFLPEDYVMALPRSVSSLHWRGSPRTAADGERIVVPVIVPSDAADEEDDEHTRYVEVIFDPRDGSFALPPPGIWSPALRQASLTLAKQRESMAEELARALAPLLPPESGDLTDWHAYLRDAFSRMDNDDVTFPETFVFPAPTASGYGKEVGRLRSRLHEPGEPEVIMLAALSQDTLLEVLKEEAGGLPPDMPVRPRIYLLLDDARFAQASALLAASDATLVQIDPARPIPQRPDYQQAWENYLRGTSGEE